MTDRVCARCSTSGRGCCKTRSTDDIRYRLGLTVEDVRRVSARMKLPPSSFAVIEPMPDSVVRQEIIKYIKGSERMFVHDIRITLRLRSDDTCSMLTGHGCPMNLIERPRFCSLFPGWYDPADEALMPFALSDVNHCMAVAEADHDPEKLFKLLDEDPFKLMLIARASDAELDLHAKATLEEIKKLVG